MSEPMRTRIDFAPDTEITEQAPGPSARHFSETEPFTPLPETHDETQTAAVNIIETALRPKRSLWRRLALVGVGLFGVSALVQGLTWTVNAWQTQDWVALSAGLAGTCVIIAGAGALAGEWRKLVKLKSRAQARDEAQHLLESHGMGEGRAFCEKLAKQAGLSLNHPALQRWHSAIQETHNDREVVTLYAQYVQPTLDAQAQREIGKSAAASAIMIAVSPLALVDMAFIAWRNVRLINRIAEIYGIELGYFSRVRLFRLVLINIAFAGASEMISDVGLDWVSQDITARLSTRAAQGLGAGLLTARLGVKAMALCRPLPWTEQDKPRLGDFRQQIVAQLKETLSQRPSSKS